jgi:hypothetical protein
LGQALYNHCAVAGLEGLKHGPPGGQPRLRYEPIDFLAAPAEPYQNDAAVLLHALSFHQSLSHQFADGMGNAAQGRFERAREFAHRNRLLPAENGKGAQLRLGALRL